jgi:hypothetical protein
LKEITVKFATCSQEEAVARAVSTGSWPEALVVHAEECAICREVAQTAHWVRALASPVEERGADSVSQETRPLHDPGLVWLRARLEKEHATNLGTLLEWVQIGTAAAGPIGLAGWVAWNWYSIEAVAGQFLLNTWPQLSIATYLLASMAPAALTVAALALGYPLLAAH